MLLITMTNTKSGSWNGKSIEKDVVKGKVIRDLPKKHHISKMLKDKCNSISWGFYFNDGWDYNVTIQKINHKEKPKNISGVAYPQIIDLLLSDEHFARNNSFFSAKKAFDYLRGE